MADNEQSDRLLNGTLEEEEGRRRREEDKKEKEKL